MVSANNSIEQHMITDNPTFNTLHGRFPSNQGTVPGDSTFVIMWDSVGFRQARLVQGARITHGSPLHHTLLSWSLLRSAFQHGIRGSKTVNSWHVRAGLKTQDDTSPDDWPGWMSPVMLMRCHIPDRMNTVCYCTGSTPHTENPLANTWAIRPKPWLHNCWLTNHDVGAFKKRHTGEYIYATRVDAAVRGRGGKILRMRGGGRVSGRAAGGRGHSWLMKSRLN